jgi:hypothetical protein
MYLASSWGPGTDALHGRNGEDRLTSFEVDGDPSGGGRRLEAGVTGGRRVSVQDA